MADIQEFLKIMFDRGASDLHITVASPPMIRVNGELTPLPYPALGQADTKNLCYSLLTDAQKHRFEEEWELDFSFAVRGLSRFRGNCFLQKGAVGGAFRTIPYQIRSLAELGLPPVAGELTKQPRGLVLVTGPTGSGKSTTLASMIDKVNMERREHVITVEDPIEFVHEHKRCVINQREVFADTKSFADSLRHVLRQDPDVVLVGEMRDLETMEAALVIAETGHLVFSTLHTMNATATIHRLLDMGAAGYMIAAALHCIVAQRLVRRVCDNCCQPTEPSPQQRAWLTAVVDPARIAKMNFQMGTGCTYCNLTGYRGRAAIYELLEIDRPLADAIRRGDAMEFASIVRQREGFTTLADAALDLVASGTTSVAEAMSVTNGLDDNEPVVAKIEAVSQDEIDSLLNEALHAERA
jgi:pilus retraction protein PilT